MAIKYPDNWGLHFLNGVFFEKDLWQKIIKKTLKAKEAFQLKNTEQRIIAIQYLGGDKLEKELGAIVLDKQTFNYGTDYLIELGKMKDSLNQPYKFLKGYDPAEKQPVYVRVHPKCQSVIEAQNSCYRLEMFGLDYAPESRT